MSSIRDFVIIAVMINGFFYNTESNKVIVFTIRLSSCFEVCQWVQWHTSCDNNNKDENTSLNVNNVISTIFL